MQLPRRTVLRLGLRLGLGVGLGGAAAAVSGCTANKSVAQSPPATAANQDAAALATARSGELHLLAAYDAMIKHAALHERGPLQVERAIHATHLAALHGLETNGAKAPANVKHALRASAHQLRRLALGATTGTTAALLASIAASHTASSS